MKREKSALAGLAIAALLSLAGVKAEAASESAPGFLLNLYHFNIQYVAGSEASMRRIVKQSFEPLVDFYLAHPDWGADFEMQGLMIEYLAAEYPEVLQKFRQLINSGQAELITFHYADQLLLAFPGHDQKWSLRLNDQLLQEHGLQRSAVIFTQEAQFGEGLTRLGREHGYEIAVMTTSQYRWFQDDDRFPYFEVEGFEVITNRDATEPGTGLRVKWAFLGDGELVATGGLSPYFPGLFRRNPVKLALLAEQFAAAEAEGYKIATISAYIRALRERGVKPSPLRPILDSPWRPEDGSGVLQWMGRYSLPWERDYELRTRNWQVRSILIEAERAGASYETLARAWGYLLNAEVSDPTGWFPLPVEVNWDEEMMEGVLTTLQQDPGLNFPALVEKAKIGLSCGQTVAAPLEVILAGQARAAQLRWSELEEEERGYCLEVEWDDRGDAAVSFPWNGLTVEYSPAMMEDVIKSVPAGELKGRNLHLALPNGLIGLGSNVWLIRDNQIGCVAAGLDFEHRRITFEVHNGREKNYRFRFYLLFSASAERALALAEKVNHIAP